MDTSAPGTKRPKFKREDPNYDPYGEPGFETVMSTDGLKIPKVKYDKSTGQDNGDWEKMMDYGFNNKDKDELKKIKEK